jgi:thiamine pyrophosphokinase
MSQVVVVIGGGPLSPRAIAEVSADAMVIAADSGLDHAVDAGLRPDALVGDLDSISAHGKMWAYAHELEIDEYPADKDATDTELALARAALVEGADLLVVGAVGDRLDHALGTIAALGSPAMAGFESIRLAVGDSTVHVIHAAHSVTIDLPISSLFSLLALHGPCRGIDVTGARWPLDAATLNPWSTRGVSNETSGLLQISVLEGVLTLVIP